MVTTNSRDLGFDLLRSHGRDADSALGDNVAEYKLLEIIEREEITPNLIDASRAPDWPSIEHSATRKYGLLGAEAVYGSEMVYYLEKQDWEHFGDYYLRYFGIASDRNEYSRIGTSYKVFEHISRRDVLDMAIKVVEQNLGLGRSTTSPSATEIDTYANLLYKAGRINEGIEWEERATQISGGRDAWITDTLADMKAGRPTWPTAQRN